MDAASTAVSTTNTPTCSIGINATWQHSLLAAQELDKIASVLQVTNDEGLGREQGQRPSLVAETVGDEPIGTVCRQSLLESLPLRERVKGAAPWSRRWHHFEP
ncbi:hypothetical protein M431DRAFT_515146 [Trichoderma harzianum CBS 226.95]|uniref:Uncharacterized protein n=1 Tax=Trichoderma harzianum CBS 226.95 TaxID=983964 RepID=A0A2T4AUQ9_TRIHA|nr:hypothetical protein M431DRAFT_515146 [Trichoderma harzianum CBS 226.95]PTB60708.1 hypothetical protein M431DRAFT_515146 [Trichoderma harzianum CBS 226.95]